MSDSNSDAAMTGPGTDSAQWEMVDEGWGRKAVDFATLSEPGYLARKPGD
jgi:hypothetical protein